MGIVTIFRPFFMCYKLALIIINQGPQRNKNEDTKLMVALHTLQLYWIYLKKFETFYKNFSSPKHNNPNKHIATPIYDCYELPIESKPKHDFKWL